MITQPIPAIYQNGMLKPLEPLNLTNQQKVYITFTTNPADEKNEDLLADWLSVYEGFDEEDIAEIEAIALNRDNWRQKSK